MISALVRNSDTTESPYLVLCRIQDPAQVVPGKECCVAASIEPVGPL
jgi:hypothetical protein